METLQTLITWLASSPALNLFILVIIGFIALWILILVYKIISKDIIFHIRCPKCHLKKQVDRSDKCSILETIFYLGGKLMFCGQCNRRYCSWSKKRRSTGPLRSPSLST